jgi:hypothetical protein
MFLLVGLAILVVLIAILGSVHSNNHEVRKCCKWIKEFEREYVEVDPNQR